MRGDDTYRLGRRPALDGIRALAVVAVVAGHSTLPWTTNAGTTGVTVFFTLSGFLITRVLLEQHRESGTIDILRFYERRAVRLMPAAVVFLAVAGVSLAASHSSLTPVLVSAAQTANFAMVAQTPMLGLAHMWSLSMEEQFYVLWPWLLVALAHRARRLLVGALVVGTVLSVGLRTYLTIAGAPDERLMFAPDTRADAILIGCLLAVALPVLRSWPAAPLAGLGAAVVAAAVPWSGQGSWTLLPVALGAAAVIAWTATARPTCLPSRVLGSRPLAYLGGISYGIYLWHFPFVAALGRLAPFARFASVLAISTAIAVLSWTYLERPIRDRFRGRVPESVRGRVPERVSGRVPSHRYAARSGERAAYLVVKSRTGPEG
jgi:peptidoglycan/LPS O-acetylase OafA/YrhL